MKDQGRLRPGPFHGSLEEAQQALAAHRRDAIRAVVRRGICDDLGDRTNRGD